MIDPLPGQGVPPNSMKRTNETMKKTPVSAQTAKLWIDMSRAVAADLRRELVPLCGTPKGRKVVSARGAGGDETLFIDALSEKILARHLQALRKAGHRFSLLSEEVGSVDYGAPFPLLVVDPVDGSMNAKQGIPYFAISIAVYDGPAVGDAAAGYVMNLANGDEFTAARGRGATLNGKKIVNHLADKKNIDMLVMELPNSREVIDRVAPLVSDAYRIRVLGALSLCVCYTASGAVDLFLHLKKSRVIDYGAAKLVLEETGGAMTDSNGGSLDRLAVDLDRKTWLVASLSPHLIRKGVRRLKGGDA